MKKKYLFCTVLFLFGFFDVSARFNFFTKKTRAINNLNWIEVSGKRLAPQIMLDFSYPLYFERKIDGNKMQLELAFPGMNLVDFREQKAVSKLKKLRKLISNVEVFHKKVPTPRVILIITFARKDILVRWNKMEDPNRLIFDIFLKDSLKNFKSRGAMILHDQNGGIS